MITEVQMFVVGIVTLTAKLGKLAIVKSGVVVADKQQTRQLQHELLRQQ